MFWEHNNSEHILYLREANELEEPFWNWKNKLGFIVIALTIAFMIGMFFNCLMEAVISAHEGEKAKIHVAALKKKIAEKLQRPNIAVNPQDALERGGGFIEIHGDATFSRKWAKYIMPIPPKAHTFMLWGSALTQLRKYWMAEEDALVITRTDQVDGGEILSIIVVDPLDIQHTK